MMLLQKKINICYVEFQKSNIKVKFNSNIGQLQDSFKFATIMKTEDGNKIGHHRDGDYQRTINTNEKIDKLIQLNNLIKLTTK